MRALAVIGANYGDEGKGRLVDWLVARHGTDSVVVRSNGGAQAGHTVALADGQPRHVFHHLGSGTLRGAPTHMSRFMVSHPIVFADEYAVLGDRLGALPAITADPRGWVTTPWDLMVNQAIELARDGQRHGSCGLGFGETVGRNEETAFTLTVGDLHAPGLEDRLRIIRNQWLPARIAALGLDMHNRVFDVALSDGLLGHFVEQCRHFAQVVALRDDASLVAEPVVIFEGAQGLCLDQRSADFPYVTRSNTGLANILDIAGEAGIAEIAPHYITRCYMTRHGRGPMDDERDIAPLYAVDDPTNRPNPWQETLRFGLIDPGAMAARIAADTALASGRVALHPALAISCLDQARGDHAWLDEGAVIRGDDRAMQRAFAAHTGLDIACCFAAAWN